MSVSRPLVCCRCDAMAENPPSAGPVLVNGRVVERCTLCVDCFALQFADRGAFWGEGWKRYPSAEDHAA